MSVLIASPNSSKLKDPYRFFDVRNEKVVVQSAPGSALAGGTEDTNENYFYSSPGANPMQKWSVRSQELLKRIHIAAVRNNKS